MFTDLKWQVVHSNGWHRIEATHDIFLRLVDLCLVVDLRCVSEGAPGDFEEVLLLMFSSMFCHTEGKATTRQRNRGRKKKRLRHKSKWWSPLFQSFGR